MLKLFKIKDRCILINTDHIVSIKIKLRELQIDLTDQGRFTVEIENAKSAEDILTQIGELLYSPYIDKVQIINLDNIIG